MNIELSRKPLDLSSAIAEGDIRVLLMVLVHMTGDEKWLEPPYKPKRDVRLIPDPDAGVPKEIQDEIRAAALQYVRKISGTSKPSQANQEAFARAVEAVTDASRRLLDELVTSAPPRDREVEAARARARAALRYGVARAS